MPEYAGSNPAPAIRLLQPDRRAADRELELVAVVEIEDHLPALARPGRAALRRVDADRREWQHIEDHAQRRIDARELDRAAVDRGGRRIRPLGGHAVGRVRAVS